MGKKIDKETISKTKKNVESEIIKESKGLKKDKTNNQIKKKPNKNNQHNSEKVQEEDLNTHQNEVKKESVMNDQEELSTLIDLNARYQELLIEVKEKLTPLIDQNMIKKAIKCIKSLVLKKYEDSTNILQNEQEEFLFLNFTLGKLPVKFSMRPVSIQLPNSLYGSKFNTQICLIVKDPRSKFKDLGIKSQLPFKLKVLDIQKLKLKFSRFHERRALIKDNELFLCDSKIYMMLKKLLGKPFYSSKKYPVPIKLDYSKPEEIKNEILNLIEKTTCFYMTHGPNYSVKISRAISTNEEILENINLVINQNVAHILKWGVGFEDLKTISIKGTNSLELPIFNQLTNEEIKSYFE